MSECTFRRIGDADLPLLHRWLNEPGVLRFWKNDDISWPSIIAQYGSGHLRSVLPDAHPDFVYDEQATARDREHMESYVAMIDDEPIGWIQCYPVDTYEDEHEIREWRRLGFDESGAGINHLVGDPRNRGTGLGSSMIESFVEKIVFGQHPEWEYVGASPVRENVACCRALVKAGLTLFGSFEDPRFGTQDFHGRFRDDA